ARRADPATRAGVRLTRGTPADQGRWGNRRPLSTVSLAVGRARSRLVLVKPDARADSDLIRAFARKEQQAADELYRRFAPRVFGLGMVMLGYAAQAEDLVQDTFVKVWRKCATYDAVRGWLDTWVL